MSWLNYYEDKFLDPDFNQYEHDDDEMVALAIDKAWADLLEKAIEIQNNPAFNRR